MFSALDLVYSLDDRTTEFLELLAACLDDCQPTAIHEQEGGDLWRVFFRTAESRDEAARALKEQFGDRLTSVTAIEVPDEGWAARSQAQLGAVRIGRIVVAPPWERTKAGSGDVVVVIEPSMGFGTGHHATTRLCLELLQERSLSGRRVIDVGTGSGVLAIASCKLGAAHAVAVDCDADALQNARENLERNCAAGVIDLVEADLGALRIDAGDIVLANLTSAVLRRYAASLEGLVRPDGCLIVSGFGFDELPEVERAFGRRASEPLTDGSWCAALFGSRFP